MNCDWQPSWLTLLCIQNTVNTMSKMPACSHACLAGYVTGRTVTPSGTLLCWPSTAVANPFASLQTMLVLLVVSQVEYTVDGGAPPDWPHKTGHISSDMAKAALFGPAPLGAAAGSSQPDSGDGVGAKQQQTEQQQGAGDKQQQTEQEQQGQEQQQQGGDGGLVVTLLCGPPPMIERACKPALKDMGFSDEHVIEF